MAAALADALEVEEGVAGDDGTEVDEVDFVAGIQCC